MCLVFMRCPVFGKKMAMKPHFSSKDFLSDELFLYWRLNPTKEMDLFWTEYITRNDHLKVEFNEAIEEFDKINRLPVSIGLQEIKQGIQPEINQEVKQVNNQGVKLEINQGINQKIKPEINQENISQNKKRRSKLIYFAASAAAVALLALITYIYFTDNNKLYPEPETASIGEVIQDGSVQLYSGNRVVTLDNNSVLKISEEGKTALIEDHDSESEVYLDNINNKLVVPYGHRSSIKLSDGSMVYLNSGTTIEFPTAFNKKRREITVSGEIFIEVAENKNQPFVIHTDRSMITVHGTSFNLSSYSGEKSESVVLVEGSVEIANSGSSLLLKPNEMAEIAGGTISRSEINVSEYISWKKGYLELNNIPLTDLLLKISRYYNVEFRYKNELSMSARTCMGKLFLSDNLDDVLEAFAGLTDLSYNRESDNMIYINDVNTMPMKK